MKRHERPIKRTNPSGKDVWVARYTDRHGNRRSAGTFKLQRDAQNAIDAAYERDAQAPRRPDTVGAYAETWTQRHPRSERTNRTNNGRLRAVLHVEIEGVPLRDWPLAELRRRHATDLVDHMLRVQRRAASGALNILRTLSAMVEDAISDEVCDANPFKGVKVRASDPRVVKAARKPRVWSWEQMHALCAAAGAARTGKHEPAEIDAWRPVYAEAMLRVLADCGLRLGELLGLERRDYDGQFLHLRGSAHNGIFTEGDQETKKHVRSVPVPDALAGLLGALPARLDTRLLFPSPRGRMWQERNFYRDVWDPARKGSKVAAAPHDFRHSWVTHLRAAGIDPADLADAAGHTVETATARYTHSLGRSADAIKKAVGQ